MRKRSLPILIAFLLLLFCLPAASAANNVSTLSIHVVIADDGSASVTQVWQGTFREGTENFIPIEYLDGMDISNFSVSDQNGVYTNIGTWDVDASFEEKAGNCGIVTTSDGYELCWGITEYGTNTYTLSYTVEGLVGAYSDYDGFNFRFVNDHMDTFPTDATVTIALIDGTRLDSENSGIWAFGYDGQVEFQGGNVVAYTDSSLSGSENMTIMVAFEKGVLHPTRTGSGTFEDVKQRAFEGSDYTHDNDGAIIAAIMGGILSVIAVFVVFVAIRKNKLKKLYQGADYFRETPNNGNLPMSYYLGTAFDQCSDGTIIGATILRLINCGSLQPVTEQTGGLWSKETVSMQLIAPPTGGDEFDESLYHILQQACGSDGILQEKELQKWSEKHADTLRSFIESASDKGAWQATAVGCFQDKAGRSLSHLTEAGTQQLQELMGLKKYLLEFSLIHERGLDESVIWQDYLVYAVLLDIGEKVAQQLGKLIPPDHPQYQQYYMYQQNLYFAYHYNYVARDGMYSAERASGGGGSASFGGGGGFSGGGSGGGSR